ncbi:MAG: S-layer homology domain-containing protein [Ruminococcaceae bacterium]|nr:S-layer homology domain-containing protein [Oscillospiraceae bacterium]
MEVISVKKRFLCLLLTGCLLCCMLCTPAAATFTDISDPDVALAAGVLEGMGIVSGVRQGEYSPDTTLTRAQFCVLIIHTTGKKDLVNTYTQKTLFTDVKPGNWYTGYVNLAYSLNLLSGYGNGKFGPDDPITYGQAATLLLKVLNYTSTEIGKVWPTDYVNYAHSLELDEGLSLSANDRVSRGQAAILLYNTLNTHPKGGSAELYCSFSDTTAAKTAILLATDAENGTQDELVKACVVGSNGVSIEYFSQKNTQSDALIGCIGELLVNSAGKVVGFMPSSTRTRDVVITQAKASGITDTAGTLHKITGSAATIIGEDLYSWNTNGYLQANSHKSKTARLFYDDEGNVNYVYISAGIATATTAATYAQTSSPATEFVRSLCISGNYTITKNGAPATADDLARYDTAYFDSTNRTLRTSDYFITGYLQAASPALDGAETVTVAGCAMPVLESAWDSLGQYKLGDKVTLLLTDNGKVAAAVAPRSGEMLGVLSADGTSITLCGSDLVITAAELEADVRLAGVLVRCRVDEDTIYAYAYTDSISGQLQLTDMTLGSYPLAPGCRIYEYAGGKGDYSYVYSLSGVRGQASTDFSDITWTNTISSSDIRAAHLNSAGQVDVLLLHDVTGNSWLYGSYTPYRGEEGIASTSGGRRIYNDAATLTNSGGVSHKFLSSYGNTRYPTFSGVALGNGTGGNPQAAGLATLDSVAVTAGDFFLQDDRWFVSCGNMILPVSEGVQVCITPSDTWSAGEDGIRAALSSGLTLRAYYEKDPAQGGQVRILTAE